MTNDTMDLLDIRNSILKEIEEGVLNDRNPDSEKIKKLGEKFVSTANYVLFTSRIDVYSIMLNSLKVEIRTDLKEPTTSTYKGFDGYVIGINPILLTLLTKNVEEMITIFLHEIMHISMGHNIEFRSVRKDSEKMKKQMIHLGTDLAIMTNVSDFVYGGRQNSSINIKPSIPEFLPSVVKVNKMFKDKYGIDINLKEGQSSLQYIEQLLEASNNIEQEEMDDASQMMMDLLNDMIQNGQNNRDDDSLNNESEVIKDIISDLNDIEDDNQKSKNLGNNKLPDKKDIEEKIENYLNQLDDMNGNSKDENNDSKSQSEMLDKANDMLDKMDEINNNSNFDKSNHDDLSNNISDLKEELLKQLLSNSMNNGGDGSGEMGDSLSDLLQNSDSMMISDLSSEDILNDGNDSLSPMENDSMENSMKNDLQELLENAINSSSDRSTIPGHFQEMINILKRPPKIKWQKYLTKRLGSKRSGFRKTILRRNRRQPHRNDIRGALPDKKIGRCLAAIDTSASMSTKEIEEVIAELYGISHRLKMSLVLIFFSSDVEEVVEVTNSKDINSYVMGRGGTVFSSVFNFINKKENVKKYNFTKDDTLIFFSDGFGEYNVDYGFLNDIIWVVTEDEKNLSVNEPKGKVLKLTID